MSSITIRRCAAADADALALIGQATFLETFAGVLAGADILAHCAAQHVPTLYAQWLGQPGVRLWLAELDGAPVGYQLLCPAALPVQDPRPDDLEIKRIYLLHRFQGGGLGRRLIECALDDARGRSHRVLLGVYAGNVSAQSFYTRIGFRQVGQRRFRVGSRDYDDNILALELQS